MFALVEEFILPYVVDHARPQLSGDDYRVRALLGFAGEEAKHIHLFKRFREEFEEGFGSKCEFIGPADDVTRFVLVAQPSGSGDRDSTYRVDDAQTLYRGRQGQPEFGFAVYQPAQEPLAGRIAAYQARYTDGRVSGAAGAAERGRQGL